MKCQHWVGKNKCNHFGPVNCAGRDLDCDIIEGEPSKPNPVPRFVYDELKAQNAALLAALKRMLTTFDMAMQNNAAEDCACDEARAAISQAEGKGKM